MDEKPREEEPKAAEKPGRNAPEIKEHKEPEPEIKEDMEIEDRFEATDN